LEGQELRDFIAGLEIVRRFLGRLMQGRVHVQFFGLDRVAIGWIRKEDRELLQRTLDNFQLSIVASTKLARSVDADLLEGIQRVLDQSRLEDTLAKLALFLSWAEHTEPPSLRKRVAFALYRRELLPFPRESHLSGDVLSPEKTYFPLERLITILKKLENIWEERRNAEESTFPGGTVNITVVLELLDRAVDQVRSAPINEQLKRQLAYHVVEVAQELKKSRPSWAKIIGGLVIASTLIGGVANAPQAANNLRVAASYLREAFKYIFEAIPVEQKPVVSIPEGNPPRNDESVGP